MTRWPVMAFAIAAATVIGCVDPRARFDEFTVVDGGPEGEPEGEALTEIPDLGGTFYLSLAPSFSPDQLIRFIAVIEFSRNSDDTAVLDVTLTPLSVNGQMPVGDPITVSDVAVDASGRFAIDLGMIKVAGAANPISGTEISAMIRLDGSARSTEGFCGEVTGVVTSPINVDLGGSRWAARRVPDGAVGTALPAPVTQCAEVSTPGDPDPIDPGPKDPAPSLCPNGSLLINGDFEDGAKGWQQHTAADNRLIRVTNDNRALDRGDELPPLLSAHKFSHAAWLGGRADADDSLVQEFDVPADVKTLTIEGFVWVTGRDGGQDHVSVVLRDTATPATTEPSAQLERTGTETTLGWTQFLLEPDAARIAGKRVRLEIASVTDATGNTNAFFDSIEVRVTCDAR